MGGFQQRPWTPTKRRGPIAAEYTSPGPACVTLPTLVGGKTTTDSKRGRAPAFSFGSRHGGKIDTAGPGPGQYNVTGLSAKGKDTPPAATLHSRPKEGKHANTPAPGDYNPEKSVHDNSPKYTFGHKTNVEKQNSTPAPGEYSPEKFEKIVDNSPKYSFGLKTIIEKPSSTPAPGEYSPEKFEKIVDNSPKYSFGLKTIIEKPSSTPAPGEYSPEKFEKIVDNSPKYSFGLKTIVEKPSSTPAPNVYNIPPSMGGTKEGNKKAAPAFSISGRQKEFIDDRVNTPGPGAYNNVNSDSIKTKSPSYSVSTRYTLPSDHSMKPGPGAYSPEKVQLDLPPAHTFGIKHSDYIGHLRSCVY